MSENIAYCVTAVKLKKLLILAKLHLLTHIQKIEKRKKFIIDLQFHFVKSVAIYS